MNRREARHEILAAANKRRDKHMPRLRMRHINQAVAVVRRRRLVSKDVLTAAGFRSTEAAS